MEDNSSKQSKIIKYIYFFKMNMFNVFYEIMKDVKISKWTAIILMLITFFQFVSLLFEPTVFTFWKDAYLLSFFMQAFNFVRIIPTVVTGATFLIFCVVYFIGIFIIVLILAFYIIISIQIKFSKNISNFFPVILRFLILITQWILTIPMIDVLMVPLRCSLIKSGFYSYQCYGAIHLTFVIISIISIIIFFSISTIISILLNESNPILENTFSRINSLIEFEIMMIRFFLGIIVNVFISNIGSWVICVICLLIGICLTIQYIYQIPFYQYHVSVALGASIMTLTWISINGIATLIFEFKGALVIICIGIPIITILVISIRDCRMNSIFVKSLEKIKNDKEIITQIQTFQNSVKYPINEFSFEIVFTGFINLHTIECQSLSCPCRMQKELYDPTNDKFSDRSIVSHKDQIFLKQFNRKLYEDAINKFTNSNDLLLAYSFFLFDQLKNIHASFKEILNVEKNKPSLIHQFRIFCFRKSLEKYLQNEATGAKDAYVQLPNIIDFEAQLVNCEKSIEKACTFQREFWLQLTNVMPDLNLLEEINSKIELANKDVHKYWKKLFKINPYHKKACALYYSYLNEIKHHSQKASEFMEKSKTSYEKNSKNKSLNILFSEETAILHVSGSLENPGKILKVNYSFTKIFGYNKSEGIGHFVNILMPKILGESHNRFLEYYFRSGREKVFIKDRFCYALHRNGYSFQAKLLVKYIPNLKEEIQYVGMIRPTHSDKNFIITNTHGLIDSFSLGIGSLIQLSSNFFKENKINIQVLIPDLIPFFKPTGKSLESTLKESGGQKYNLYVPKDFAINIPADLKKKNNDKNLSNHQLVCYKDLNKYGNSEEVVPDTFSPKFICDSKEYQNPEVKLSIKCELSTQEYGNSVGESPLKIFVFKISKDNIIGVEESSQASGDDFDKQHLTNQISNTVFSFKESESNENSQHNEKEHLISEQLRDEKLKIMNYLLQSASKAQKREFGQINYLEKEDEEKEEENKGDQGKSTEKIGITISSEKRQETEKQEDAEDKKFQKLMLNPNSDVVKREINESENIIDLKRTSKSKNPDQLEEDEELKEGEETPKIKLANIKIGSDSPLLNSSRDENQKYQENKVSEFEIEESNKKSKNNDLFEAQGFKEGVKNIMDKSAGNKDILDQINVVNDTKKTSSVNLPKLQLNVLLDFENNGELPESNKKEQKIINEQKLENIQNKDLQEKLENEDEKKLNLEQKEIISSLPSKLLQSEMLRKSKKTYTSNIIKMDNNNPIEENSTPYEETEEEIKLKANLRESALKHKMKENKDNAIKEVDDENEIEEENNENEEGKENRSNYALRSAIDEKFIPTSLKNLKITAMVGIFIILALAIAFFTIQIILYQRININSENIFYSQLRIFYLIDINLRVNTLLLINSDNNKYEYFNSTIVNTNDLAKTTQSILKDSATLLNNAQTNISLATTGFSNETNKIVNPQSVLLYYKAIENIPNSYDYTLWQSVTEIIISAYRIASMNISEISMNDTTVYFVVKNSLNNVIISLEKSSLQIENDSKEYREQNLRIFSYLLIVASVCFIISVIFFIPALRRIKKNKEEVYELFLYIKKKHIKDQLSKCNSYLSQFRTSNDSELTMLNEVEEIVSKEEKKDQNSNPEEAASHDTETTGLRKRKRFRKLNTNIGLMLIQLIFMLLIMEGYFILIYFLAASFLNSISALEEEFCYLIKRQPTYNYLLLMEKQLIFHGASTKIENILSMDFVKNYQSTQYSTEQKFIDIFSRNQAFHSDTYNQIFHDIMYEDACKNLDAFAKIYSECKNFSNGIITRGIYSSIIQYWDFMIQFNNDFILSMPVDDAKNKSTLSDIRLWNAQKMQDFYFNKSMEYLISQFQQDMNLKFSNENIYNRVYFILFILYLGIIFIFLWTKFIDNIQNELWIAKSSLAIIPAELLVSISHIRQYILKNSSTAFYNKGTSD